MLGFELFLEHSGDVFLLVYLLGLGRQQLHLVVLVNLLLAKFSVVLLKFDSHVSYLHLCVLQLVNTDVEMVLQLFKLFFLFLLEVHKMTNEVKEISWSDIVELLC